MKSSFWTPYISDHAIKAICWTLIHSLWIGLAIALLSGLVITLTRRSTAALRYNLLCGILVLFVVSVGITFLYEIRMPAVPQSTPVHLTHIVYAPVQHVAAEPATTSQPSVTDRVVVFLNDHSNVLFTAWMLLFVLKSLKMAGGVLYIQRIRSYKVHEVPDEFKNKIALFAGQIGIRKKVRLMQSELVKVPVAVGWLKPMILLPMGILVQLSPGQLDSILWHELAHIRRRDYLVNILQGLVETVFFFNPGLLWLSSLIRAEREACCDDMVLSRTSRKANYLEALLACGIKDDSRVSLAMSIGAGNQLRDRMKRMVNQENKRLSMIEKVVLIAGLIALSAFTRFHKSTGNAVKNHVKVAADSKQPIMPLADAVLEPFDTLIQVAASNKNGQALKAAFRLKKDTAFRFTSILFKNGEDISNNDISAKDTAGNQYHLITQNNKLVAMEINGQKVQQADLYQYERMIWQIEKELAEKRRFSQDDVNRTKVMAMIKASAKNFDKRRQLADSNHIKSTYRIDRLEAARGDKLSADLQRVTNVIASLVNANVVPNAGSVKWFGLTDSELIVNGQKQSEELRRKLASNYGVVKNYGLFYGPVEMTGTGVFIDADDQRRSEGLRAVADDKLVLTKIDMEKAKNADLARRTTIQKMKSDRARNDHASADVMAKVDEIEARHRKQDAFDIGTNMQGAINGIIADLVNAKVIGDRSDLIRFNLTNSALMVNGKKLPEDIHQKLKTKYLQKDNFSTMSDVDTNPYFGLHYNAKTGNRGIGITSGPDSP